MIKRIVFALGMLSFLIGLGVFLYPQVNGWLIDRENQKTIESFKEEKKNQINSEIASQRVNQEFYDAMKEYNLKLFQTGQTGLKDAWSYEQSPLDLESFAIKEGIIGYIEISKIDVDLPLYLGASADNMEKGAAILGETSLPIGGENSNCVIACHRGFRGAQYFKDIEKLQIGDRIYLINPWEELIYQVKEIAIIDPYEVSRVLIQEGKDMITLVTCHPYRVSTHRYVVYCERVE